MRMCMSLLYVFMYVRMCVCIFPQASSMPQSFDGSASIAPSPSASIAPSPSPSASQTKSNGYADLGRPHRKGYTTVSLSQ